MQFRQKIGVRVFIFYLKNEKAENLFYDAVALAHTTTE